MSSKTHEEMLEINVENYIRLSTNKGVDCDKDFVREQFFNQEPLIEYGEDGRYTVTYKIIPKR